MTVLGPARQKARRESGLGPPSQPLSLMARSRSAAGFVVTLEGALSAAATEPLPEALEEPTLLVGHDGGQLLRDLQVVAGSQFADLDANECSQFAKSHREWIRGERSVRRSPVIAGRANLIHEIAEQALQQLELPSKLRTDFRVVKMLSDRLADAVRSTDAVLLNLQREVLPQHAAISKQVENPAGNLPVIVFAFPLAPTKRSGGTRQPIAHASMVPRDQSRASASFTRLTDGTRGSVASAGRWSIRRRFIPIP